MKNIRTTKQSRATGVTPQFRDGFAQRSNADFPSLLSKDKPAMKVPQQDTQALLGSWGRGPPNSGSGLLQPSKSLASCHPSPSPVKEIPRESGAKKMLPQSRDEFSQGSDADFPSLPSEDSPAARLYLIHTLEAQNADKPPQSNNKLTQPLEITNPHEFPLLPGGTEPAAKGPSWGTRISVPASSEPREVIELLQDFNKHPQASECTDSHQSPSLSVQSEHNGKDPQRNLESPTMAPSEPSKATGSPQPSNKLPQLPERIDLHHSRLSTVRSEQAVEDDVAQWRPSPADPSITAWLTINEIGLQKGSPRTKIGCEKQDSPQPQTRRRASPIAARPRPRLTPKGLIIKILREVPEGAEETGIESITSVMRERLRHTLVKSHIEKLNSTQSPSRTTGLIPSTLTKMLEQLRRDTEFISPAPAPPGLMSEQTSRGKERVSAARPAPIAPPEPALGIVETTNTARHYPGAPIKWSAFGGDPPPNAPRGPRAMMGLNFGRRRPGAEDRRRG